MFIIALVFAAFKLHADRFLSRYKYQGSHRPGLQEFNPWMYNKNWWSNRGLVYVPRALSFTPTSLSDWRPARAYDRLSALAA